MARPAAAAPSRGGGCESGLELIIVINARDGETQADAAGLFSDDADTVQPGGLVMDETWSTRRPVRTIFAERLRDLQLAPYTTNPISAVGMDATTGTYFVGRLTTVSNPYFGTKGGASVRVLILIPSWPLKTFVATGEFVDAFSNSYAPFARAQVPAAAAVIREFLSLSRR